MKQIVALFGRNKQGIVYGTHGRYPLRATPHAAKRLAPDGILCPRPRDSSYIMEIWREIDRVVGTNARHKVFFVAVLGF